ncbi:ubiquitin-conjugating enzyme (huntingtin interacting protein 2) [Cryptococcus neoformans]|uniref:Ubiquitin-conjugating enzyme E2 1 n=2 Tax=Cryptococcus neoformans TaxID=5207 RepID=A0A854QIM1_CRYNE|nr:ubiquitin-conjugating enzyme (huntingtin interacting protein 2) [Cryptococcus neoformans var. grubii H99]AUB23361.1 ubiquitin-conjugating enzyme (huntingtin interacting protein 2) [Cryptococcus neoformans var. grubii]OWT40976.1 ubiquitin-conjugating enzyme (huntingtin interacting protein 2) [Cryptococcus neoformans var. grubii Bt1]OWZ34360.1 ubiquitin-conjugating enzyme (huntingtin interacting protein 2) [Cryptococcus neoformans var. grubii AD2-60a]OWZ46444.1 ubiquitin-conjugating enzyme (hu|eukprot:XP_012048212.1 ubiquitin-conjugating enzyme (huntingtin interacting protein 2) [Cryptococcus neoformans var. grubii H99]
MSDARLRRVQKEIKDCAKDKTSGIAIEMIDDNPFHLVGAFPGPPDTPYEGGYYEVDIQIPETYPFQPVKMKFITKVYHPNVSSASGAICLDILKDAWSPVLTLKSTLISLQSLLCEPIPSDPQDAQVAKHYLTDRNSFNDTAKHWAQAYAQAPAHKQQNARGEVATDAELAGLAEEHVVSFTDMGFSRDKVISVLRRRNYRGNNVNPATYNSCLEELLQG